MKSTLNIRLKVLSRAVRQKINNHWVWFFFFLLRAIPLAYGGPMQIGKEEVKLVLLVSDMVLCTENPKDSTTKKNYYNYSMNSSMLEDKTLIC